jgi:carbon storage regulator
MLVLSRQRDETIMIGDDIEITVVDIRGDKVRLGITAPTRIAVHRKEVYESIRRENEQAAQMNLVGGSLAGQDLSAPPRLSPGPARTRVASIAARPGGRDAQRSESQSGANGATPTAAIPPVRRTASER